MAYNDRSAPDGENLFQFPCELDIKVLVRVSEEMEQRVVALLLQHLEPAQVLRIRHRKSRKGNYLSLSCLISARKREELDGVYATLSGHPEILMVL